MVEAKYLVEVSVFGYNNPTGRCQGCLLNGERGCCDQFNTMSCDGELQCDSFFTYCLGNAEEGGCAAGAQRRISDANIDDEVIDFNQSIVLGLDNPLTLEGVTDRYRVSDYEVQACINLGGFTSISYSSF